MTSSPRNPELNHTLLAISSLLPSFTKSEQRVAETVLNDPEGAVYSSITDLAEKAGVGETSVIRFCRKLGFQGYQEFKLAVAQQLTSPAEQMAGDIEESDSLATLKVKLTALNAQNIQNSSALLNEQALQEAVNLFRSARTITFMGVGSSGMTAMDARYRFFRLGLQVNAETDTHGMRMTAALARRGDVVMAITTSGSTRDLVDAFRLAKANDASTVCLTSHARSPITQHADVVLLTASKETPLQGGSFAAKLAQLHALDLVSTILSLQMKDSAYEALEKTAKSVLDKLY
ncbi:MurR/RpiR family transcriptional regulator [Paenibacillus sp. HJGM_3]|uniref:MurR/RpiR family transcriptional regulator n=1 Tax=Paenibacillus sp. HJGM_3 TaxID=3379816 RepID=UPI003859FAC9